MPARSLSPPAAASAHKRTSNAFKLGPRKKITTQDPLVSSGRHFGRTTHSFCNIQTLLTNGIATLQDDQLGEALTAGEQWEFNVFHELLRQVPGLEKCLLESRDKEIDLIAELLQKGANGARSDDMKGIKSVVIDWITPKGQALNPVIPRNVKTDRGFNHERTGTLLCPAGIDWSNPEIKEKLRDGSMQIAGDQWPIMLYANYQYDGDDPWNGLSRNGLLVNAYKFIFTSPSSVDQEPKATRSDNARIHGMHSVTKSSIAYISTQVRFALTSAAVFSRTDFVTDSKRFYNSIMELLDDPEEGEEVGQLLTWWNRQIFPAYMDPEHPTSQNSALARIRVKRAARKEAAAATAVNDRDQ